MPQPALRPHRHHSGEHSGRPPRLLLRPMRSIPTERGRILTRAEEHRGVAEGRRSALVERLTRETGRLRPARPVSGVGGTDAELNRMDEL